MRKVDEEKINKLIQEKCFTYEELSKKAGITTASLHRIRTGRVVPRATSLKKICEALECEPKDILKD